MLDSLGDFEDWIEVGNNMNDRQIQRYRALTGNNDIPNPDIDTCECGHWIIHHHYIMNVKTKEIKVVGSECISKFSSDSDTNMKCIECRTPITNKKYMYCDNHEKIDYCGKLVYKFDFVWTNKTCTRCTNTYSTNKKIYDPLSVKEAHEYIVPPYRTTIEYVTTCFLCQRIYFIVPYKDKEHVKKLGLWWDKDKRKWFAPNTDIADEVCAKNLWGLYES